MTIEELSNKLIEQLKSLPSQKGDETEVQSFWDEYKEQTQLQLFADYSIFSEQLESLVEIEIAELSDEEISIILRSIRSNYIPDSENLRSDLMDSIFYFIYNRAIQEEYVSSKEQPRYQKIFGEVNNEISQEEGFQETGSEFKESSNLVYDIDSNVYHTIKIGTQVWMVENLKTTKYNDGTAIPMVTDATAWRDLATPAYCWYKNNEAVSKNIYGALYNWFTIDTGKLCPKGWHVPSDDEWTALIEYLGGESVAGGKLKEASIKPSHWQCPNTGATNETGFSALPGGLRFHDGTFDYIGYWGIWWSSTGYSLGCAWGYGMSHDSSDVNTKDNNELIEGFSVRCVKDY